MERLAFDTESELIERGNCAPRLVCMSLARPGRPPDLFGRVATMPMFRSFLVGDGLIIGHNIGFDFGVLCSEDETLVPAVFDLYRAGRVRDTDVREALISIREGKEVHGMSSLGDLSAKYGGVPLNKGADSWRYRYGQLMHTPLDQWPQAAKDYALTDAAATLRVFDGQGGSLVSPDEVYQTRAAFVLHLMRCWGFRTDAPRVAELRRTLEIEVAATDKAILQAGLMRPKGTKKQLTSGTAPLSRDNAIIKGRIEAAYKAMGRRPPMTGPSGRFPEGQISTDKATLLETGDPDLKMMAEAATNEKLLSTFVPLVEGGVKYPIAPRWNVLVRSGRTSAGSKDDPGNWQNPAKKGGIRECVIPRPGYIFGGADYSQQELCSLSQILLDWFGDSAMARAIQAGEDLHLSLACSTPLLLGDLSYARAKELLAAGDARVEKMRQFAKVGNFGYPGGLGPDSFVSYADGMGVTWPAGMTKLEASASLKNAWLNRWAEMRLYFGRIARLVETGLPFVQPRSGRVRGRPEFCSTANSAFQGLAADASKEALWQTAQKCYTDKRSALFGSRVILFLHDELILEMPIDRAPEACDELAKTMVEAMKIWTPDIPVKAEPRLMDRWRKGAKEVRDANGRLVVWQPKEKMAA